MNETSWTTEVLQDTFSFRWTVKHFNKFPQIRYGSLESPIFTGGIITRHSWQIIISSLPPQNKNDSSVRIGVYLKLAKLDKNSKKNEINATFEMNISQGNIKRSVNGYGRYSVGLKFGQRSEYSDTIDPQIDAELIICCKVVFEGEHIHQRESGFEIDDDDTMVSQKPVLTVNDFKRLLETSEDADVTILTPTGLFKSHRLILSCRSPVFKRMFQANMTESQLNTVLIGDFQADVVKGMLNFVYGQPVRMNQENTLEYLRIAEKYDLKELKEMSQSKFLQDCLQIENVVDALVVADMYNAPEFKERLLEYFKLNKAAVMETEIFENLVETNRKLFIEICRI